MTGVGVVSGRSHGLAMEDFNEKPLDSTPTKLHVHEYAIQDFTDHINS